MGRGRYRAVLKPGTKISRSPFADTIGGEAQFDFDSAAVCPARGGP